MDEKYYRSIPQRLITWGSEEVIEASIHSKRTGLAGEKGNVFDFETVMFAIRADLGYTNEGLERGDLLRTFLEGVDEFLEEEKQRTKSETDEKA